ncbi:hypothetical protein D3C72_1849080 [compost metagenome]
MSYYITYLDGSDNFQEPMKTNFAFKRNGIRVGVVFIQSNSEFISWENILRVDFTSKLVEQRVSIGKALIGGLIFGPAGAIVGGLSGKQVNDRMVSIIRRKEDGSIGPIVLEGTSGVPLLIKRKIDQELTKRYGTTDRTAAVDSDE